MAADDAPATYYMLIRGEPTESAQGEGWVRYVVPGNPAASLIMEKLKDNPTYGDAMPPVRYTEILPLTETERALIESWIACGAED